MSKYCPAEREYPFPLSHRKKQLRKILHCLLALECADNLFYLVIIQTHLFNPLASLYSSPNLLASIKITLSVVADLSKNSTLTFVPVLANTLLGMETQPNTTLSSTIL